MIIFGSEILKDKGFTIIEVLIAMIIFSIALLALVSLATTSMKATEMGRRMTQGVNLATQKMESLKAVPFKHLNRDMTVGGISKTCTSVGAVFSCTPTPNTDTLDNAVFTWSWDVEYMDLNGNGVVFGDSPGSIDDGDMRLITVFVDWSDIMGDHSVELKMLRSTL